MTRTCPVPGCTKELPSEHSAFCADHHFQVPGSYTRLIMRTSIEAARAGDDDRRKHLTEQRDGYVRSVLRTMGWSDHAA